MGIGVVFTLVALALYWPCLRGSFILDDWAYIAENVQLQTASSPLVFWMSLDQADYWPIAYTLFWSLWRTFGDDTLAYHGLNLCCHIGNALLLISLLRRLQARWPVVAGLLFLVHPVQVEAVAWIFQLKTLLSTSFFLLALTAYVKSAEEHSLGAYLAATLLFACGLLTKTSVVVLPAVLLLYHLTVAKHPVGLRPLVIRIAPFALLATVFTWITCEVNQRNFAHRHVVAWDASPLERVLAVGRHAFFYARTLVLPNELLFVYPRVLPDAGQAPAYLCLIGLLLVIAAGFWWQRRQRGSLGVFAAGWYGLGLLPVLGLVSVPYMRFSLVADHWQYLASCGGVVWLTCLWPPTLKSVPGSRLNLAAGLALSAVVALWAAKTRSQTALYSSEEPLLSASLAANPKSAYLWYLRGVNEARKDDSVAAQGSFARAAELDPAATMALYNLGVLSAKQEHFAKANELLAAFIAADPYYAPAYHLRALLLEQQGQPAQAERLYREALRLGLTGPLLPNGLCALLQRQHRDQEAAPICAK